MTQKEPVSKKEYYNISCRIIKELDYGLQKQVEDIIDETKCEDYNNGCCKNDYYSSSVATTVSCDPKNMRCDFYVNKLVEQLARKTAECKELKEECERHRSNAESYCKSYQYSCVVNGKITDKALKYKQALDEIAAHYQKVIKNITTYDDSYDANISIEALHNISDIINKAKEQE